MITSVVSITLPFRVFPPESNRSTEIFLLDPAHKDFWTELTSRYAYSLVHAERYTEAIPLLKQALESNLGDRQRLFLYLGAALQAIGDDYNAKTALLAARAKG